MPTHFIREQLDEPALTRRNAVKQHSPEELVRARRQHERDVRPGRVLTELEQAAARQRGLRVEEARLVKMISTRGQTLGARVS